MASDPSTLAFAYVGTILLWGFLFAFVIAAWMAAHNAKKAAVEAAAAVKHLDAKILGYLSGRSGQP